MKIIFLDFDGVLRHRGWEGEAIAHLNTLTDETKANIVVSSDWRHTHELRELRNVLCRVGVTGFVLDMTPIIRDSDIDLPSGRMDIANPLIRSMEVSRWISIHKECLAPFSYVVLDDMDMTQFQHKQRFVHVKDKLDINDINKAKAILL